MIKIGLTGSIGMGKSTTADFFRELNVPVFDADAAVHQLYNRNGRAVPLIRAVFPDAISPDGSVDRKQLGEHLRSDPLYLGVLESFIHPWVADLRRKFLEEAEQSGAPAVLFDIPLLYETGGHRFVDVVVVVSVPADVQRDRVMSRPGMTETLFQALLKRQTPDAEKRRRADYVLFTDRGFEAARADVKRIHNEIISKYA